MDRQTFLTTLVALPGLFLVSCSSKSDDTPQQSTDPAMPPARNGTDVTFYGSMSEGHTHTVVLPDSALAMTTEFKMASSKDPGDMHLHLVTLSPDDLAKLAAGNTVKVLSSVDNGHLHYYTFMQVA
jgi:hypothetical protein